MKPTTRILIADDHAVVRMGLASLLGTQDGLEVVSDESLTEKEGSHAVF